MDWGTIVVAALSLAGTIIGSYSGMKLMSYRIEQLERKVDKISSASDEIPVIKEQIKGIDRRLADVESKVG